MTGEVSGRHAVRSRAHGFSVITRLCFDRGTLKVRVSDRSVIRLPFNLCSHCRCTSALLRFDDSLGAYPLGDRKVRQSCPTHLDVHFHRVWTPVPVADRSGSFRDPWGGTDSSLVLVLPESPSTPVTEASPLPRRGPKCPDRRPLLSRPFPSPGRPHDTGRSAPVGLVAQYSTTWDFRPQSRLSPETLAVVLSPQISRTLSLP